MNKTLPSLLPSFLPFSGCFGSSWLILYARGGYRVSVYDVRPDNLKASLERVKVELRYLEDKENEKEGFSAQQLFQRITVCDSVQECVRDSILVQVRRKGLISRCRVLM